MRFLMLNWRDPQNPLAGGAERVTQAYLEALAQRGHEAWWFANDFPGAAPTAILGGVHIVRGGGMGTSILSAIRWYRRQAPFDLVIDQHHGIPWYAPWWCRTRCVAYIHEVLGPIWSAFYPWPLSALGRWQERWTHWGYRKVPFWTACQATRDCLRAHGVRDITLIPYGVHTRALPLLEDKLLTPPIRLVTVCRLAPNKRVEHAVRLMKCLAAAGVTAQLTIVGGGEEEARLRGLVATERLQDRVTLAGQVSESEKNEILRRAHFLVHTSLREGWGLNVIEANAMGTPGLVYPVEGLIESTLDDQTGLVSAAETPESLAIRLKEVLSQPEKYQRYRRSAWERAKTFHWDVVLPQACAWLEAQARRRS